MQIHCPDASKDGWRARSLAADPSKYRRQRENWKLRRQVCEPLDALRNGPFDPWHGLDYQSNPVWRNALVLYAFRLQAYEELLPVTTYDEVAATHYEPIG